jgi:hypothetical protein
MNKIQENKEVREMNETYQLLVYADWVYLLSKNINRSTIKSTEVPLRAIKETRL